MLPVVTWVSVATIATALVLAAWHVLIAVQAPSNGCIMTYMRPQYSSTPITDEKRRYSLERYTEGTVRAGEQTFQQHSIPVLYIPGAAGSKAQARSIASEAYRQFARGRSSMHRHAPFTIYTVHLNEELSAYDAHLLAVQARFVARAIEWLHQQHPLHYMILIGHSMGGVAARAAVTLQQTSVVPLLIGVASPYAMPPLALLPSTWRLHEQLQRFGRPYLSLSAGLHDFQVPAAAAAPPAAGALTMAHVSTQDMRGVWVSTEHQCAVWCNQVAAALGSAVVSSTAQLLQSADTMVGTASGNAEPSASPQARAEQEMSSVAAGVLAAWTAHAPPGGRGEPSEGSIASEVGEQFWSDVEVSDLVDAHLCVEVPPVSSLARGWRLQHAWSASGAADDRPSLVIVFSGLPDQLQIGVTAINLTDGQPQYIDLRAQLTAFPLFAMRGQHKPPTKPADVYKGIEYTWHSMSAVSVSPSDFPGLQLQELRVHAACSTPHHFHPSLVSPSLDAAVSRCSIVSVQAPAAPAPSPPISLGWPTLIFPRMVAQSPAVCNHERGGSDSACNCLCTTAVSVHLSSAVTAWNRVFPFAELELRASTPCCAGAAQLLPSPPYPDTARHGAYLMLAPRSCGVAVRLVSAAPAGVFSLLYLGLPTLLLSTAVCLVHYPVPASASRPRRSQAVPDAAHQLLSMLALTACAPDASFAGRAVVVLAGRGLAIGMAAAAAAITGSASRALAGRVPGPHRALRALSRLGSGTRLWWCAAMVVVAALHVFLSIQLALARLFWALVSSMASQLRPQDVQNRRFASGVAGSPDLAFTKDEVDTTSGGTVSQLGSSLRARFAGDAPKERGRIVSCRGGVPAEVHGPVHDCRDMQGAAAVAAVALAAGLALPGFVARVRTAWMPPAVEDALPGLTVACGALVAAAPRYGTHGSAQGSATKLAPKACCHYKATQVCSTKVAAANSCRRVNASKFPLSRL
eukprot:jgi/Ulvmu1/3011/UM015_0051.1